MTGAKTDLLRIARVLKSNGTEGEILIGFREIVPEELNLKEPVFIFFDGLPVPFFIECFTRRGTSRALARITGVKNLADAEEIVGKELYAGKDSIESYESSDELTAGDLIGWSVLDHNGIKVGTVSDFEDIPGNPCLYVDGPSGQAMLPLHDDLIIDVDENSLTLTLVIPEGLL